MTKQEAEHKVEELKQRSGQALTIVEKDGEYEPVAVDPEHPETNPNVMPPEPEHAERQPRPAKQRQSHARASASSGRPMHRKSRAR